MIDPVVDVTVAVHTRSRPIRRAVSSIVDGTEAPVRVIVVAHNIDQQEIAANLGSLADDRRVLLIPHRDGIPSPAGPMNAGLDASTAEFFAVMGSDDEFQPGAIDSWLALQRRSGAAMVITRIRHAGGGSELSPPARPGRVRDLDPVKDRLSYRSAPLGLISRGHFGDLRFSEGLPSGEDLPFSARIWFSGHPIAFARTGPGYLVNSDAGDRVTSAPRPIADDFAFLDRLDADPVVGALSGRRRGALAIKLIRIHLFDAVVNRASTPWPDGERDALASVARRILADAGHPERWLSILDRRVLDGILDGSTPVEELMGHIRRRWNYRSPDVLLTRNPLWALHRQGPLRTYAGGYLL